MLWMGLWIWSPRHAVTTTLVGLDLESQLKSWITPRFQKIPSCSGWGSHPTWHDSHIYSKHVKGDWWTLYAVDGNMDMEPPPCCYHHTCWTGFGKSAESWITPACQMIPSCSGWGSHHTWNAFHIHSKHKLGDWQILYAVNRNMEPSPCWYCPTRGTGFGKWLKNHGSLLGTKSYHHAVVEALTPHGMIPTSILTYTRWLPNIICCGWGYGAPNMLLPPHLWDRI